MRLRRQLLPLALLGAAALCAAAAGHAIIAALTAHGFVSGLYLTYAHGSMATALLISAAIAGIVGVALLGEVAVRCGRLRRDWLEETAHGLTAFPFARALIVIVSTQLVALMAIESLEQAAQFGHPLGLGAALGAPLLIALAIHLATGLASACGVLGFMRAIVAARRSLAGVIAASFERMLPPNSKVVPTSIALRAFDCGSLIILKPPLARRIANRPPPASATA